MNRKSILAIAAVVVLIGGVGVAFATTNQTSTADPDISKDEATQIAVDHVGDGATAESASLEQEDGPVWEISVTQENGPTKEVEVDGTSGEVLEVETDDDDDGFEIDEVLESDD